MAKERDDTWFHEVSANFFSSLRWAAIILVVGTVIVYLTTHIL